MDVFTLASRYLRTRVIAWVSLLFIAFGVWANVVVNAVFDGFRERILNHIRAVQSDLTILIPDYRGYDHSAAVRRLLANEMTDRGGPIAALAPRLADHGLVAFVHSDGRYDYQRKAFANLIGVDWKAESAVVPLGAMIRSLKPEDERLRVREEDLDDPFANRAVPGVLIGTSMARKLKLRRGDELDLVTAELSPSTEERFVTSNRRFMLVGCFDSGNEEYDVQNVYVAREEFVRLKGGVVSRDARTVQARLVDFTKAEEVEKRLEDAYPDLIVETWEDENRVFLEAVRNERAMIVIILFCIILVAAGSIFGILWMMVIEKTRDIGVLRSMGLSRRRTVAVFWICGTLIGVVGSLAGCGLGVLTVTNINAVTEWLHAAFGIHVFDPSVYKFKQIPTRLVPEWVAGVCAGALVCATAASLVPAWLAARLDPVKCLKHE